MRSIAFTLLLLLGALISGGLAVINVKEGDLGRVFGAPVTPVGEPLYSFAPESVRKIQLSANQVAAECEFLDGSWQVVRPWQDRMDPRIADAIISFTLDSRVEGAIPADKVESKALGFDDGRIAVRIEDPDGEPLAKYMLGGRTAWVGTAAESGDLIPTVFVAPRDRSRKDYLYVATDARGIHGQLGDGLKRLRDHHPFLYHPEIIQLLQNLRIRTRNGELTLSRSNNKELWSITKPLVLRSDPEALTTLIQGLYKLQAINVLDRSEVTLPSDDPDDVDEIGLGYYGATAEVVLSIYPPATPDAPTVLARVSDRPNAIFELARKKAAAPNGSPGLGDLPLAVNALRDPTLTAIDVKALRGVLILPANGRPILLGRSQPGSRMVVEIDGVTQEPNQTAREALETAVTKFKVADFISDTVSDTPADLAPHGLDHPFLTLRFLGFDDSIIQLDFGRAEDGGIHAIRKGTTTVVEIDPAMLALIPTTPEEWRNTRLWALSAANVLGIDRLVRGQEPLQLGYNHNTLRWTARVGDTDRSAELATDRAEVLLNRLLGLRVFAWLAPDHEEANQALATPTAVIQVLVQQRDSEGERSGVETRRLTIAKAGGAYAYGRVDGEPSPFLLSPETLRQLSVDLFSLGD